MHILFALIFFGHGFAHLPGFLAYWKLADFKEMPYKTTVLAGKFDVGDVGIRVFGFLWLIAALAFLASSISVGLRLSWWQSAALVTSTFSLVLCIIGLPDTRFGLFVNIVLIAFLLLNRQMGWLL